MSDVFSLVTHQLNPFASDEHTSLIQATPGDPAGLARGTRERQPQPLAAGLADRRGVAGFVASDL